MFACLVGMKLSCLFLTITRAKCCHICLFFISGFSSLSDDDDDNDLQFCYWAAF